MRPALHTTIVLSSAALIAAAIVLFRTHRREHVFESRTFHQASGWGYDILVDGKIFIHQESVPATTGAMGFPSKQMAANTSELLINKMKTGKAPVVNSFDLEAIGFNDTTLHEQQSRRP